MTPMARLWRGPSSAADTGAATAASWSASAPRRLVGVGPGCAQRCSARPDGVGRHRDRSARGLGRFGAGAGPFRDALGSGHALGEAPQGVELLRGDLRERRACRDGRIGLRQRGAQLGAEPHGERTGAPQRCGVAQEVQAGPEGGVVGIDGHRPQDTERPQTSRLRRSPSSVRS